MVSSACQAALDFHLLRASTLGSPASSDRAILRATLERVEDGLLRVDVDFRHVRDEHPADLAPSCTAFQKSPLFGVGLGVFGMYRLHHFLGQLHHLTNQRTLKFRSYSALALDPLHSLDPLLINVMTGLRPLKLAR